MATQNAYQEKRQAHIKAWDARLALLQDKAEQARADASRRRSPGSRFGGTTALAPRYKALWHEEIVKHG